MRPGSGLDLRLFVAAATAWIATSLTLAAWFPAADALGLVRGVLATTIGLNPVFVVLVAWLAGRLGAPVDRWTVGGSRWVFGGFLTVLGIVSMALWSTAAGVFDYLSSGDLADPCPLGLGLFAVVFVMFLGLYPLWSVLPGVLVGPGAYHDAGR